MHLGGRPKDAPAADISSLTPPVVPKATGPGEARSAAAFGRAAVASLRICSASLHQFSVVNILQHLFILPQNTARKVAEEHEKYGSFEIVRLKFRP